MLSFLKKKRAKSGHKEQAERARDAYQKISAVFEAVEDDDTAENEPRLVVATAAS